MYDWPTDLVYMSRSTYINSSLGFKPSRSLATPFCYINITTSSINAYRFASIKHFATTMEVMLAHLKINTPLSKPKTTAPRSATMASDSTAEQLLALDDQSLARYLVNNWGPRQVLDIGAIVDWNTTPETRQDELLRRFKAVRPMAKAAQPIDYNELVTRLEAISRAEMEPPLWDDKDLLFLHPTTAQATTCGGSTTAAGVGREGKRHQIRCYHALVAEGGRPPCPLDLLRDVYRQPTEHVELMKPWLGDPVFFTGSADELGVFSRPLQRWRQFRRWQADNRGVALPGDDQDLAAFREASGLKAADSMQQAAAEVAGERDGDDGQVEARWRARRDRRRWEREMCREVGSFADSSFDDYVEAVRRRLHAHGFTDHFQLLRDADVQDTPDTWAEYLGFECWWLDWRDAELWRHRVQRDATWAELRRAGVLRDGETDVDVLVYVKAARRRRRWRGRVDLSPVAGFGVGEQGTGQQEKEMGGDEGGSSWQSATRLREDLTNQLCRDSEACRSAEAFRSSQVLLVAWARSQVVEVMKEAERKRGGTGLRDDEMGDGEEGGNPEERLAKRDCLRDGYVYCGTEEQRERWRREIEEKIMVARHRALLQIHIITAELERQAEKEDAKREKAEGKRR
ncbi:hypothetical protein MCOR21_004335 [Pyricularia oryzae]|nr:hypothetical protein MCOR34_005758 [Pyricularia oryzae]KAI6430822.1 hypothetical protein MCOR21_004335 [Pyricularia oryzae]KAI6472544.1 hypothetical protein MCOR17_002859 [Pyricularia oryzae]KAI6498595.1 hypothetical protein MCOR13_006496 [Pyricularia oryzae]KAI6588175.1 hypothetical protein MCOR04_004196 [Pyricularia oryzae]